MGSDAAEPPCAAPPDRADAASPSLGIQIVCPRTTLAVSGRPLAAASERVVKLFAAAIDQSVSPGPTVCATRAQAGAASISVSVAARAAIRKERRNEYLFLRLCRALRGPARRPLPGVRPYDDPQARVQQGLRARSRAATGARSAPPAPRR